jgi:hypothetical protein
MAPWALALYALYAALAFGGRTLVQLRRTGSTGFKGLSGRPLSAEWTGGVLFFAALLLGLASLRFAGQLLVGGGTFGGFASTLDGHADDEQNDGHRHEPDDQQQASPHYSGVLVHRSHD